MVMSEEDQEVSSISSIDGKTISTIKNFGPIQVIMDMEEDNNVEVCSGEMAVVVDGSQERR